MAKTKKTGAPASLAAELKARLKGAAGEALPEAARIRVHRSISWLARAEAEGADHDARFIFLWIAFNAAYAHEFGFEEAERELLRGFLAKLVTVDKDKALHKVLFSTYSGPVRLLIENKFVFEPFWRALREHDSSGRWESRFAADQKAAIEAVTGGSTVKVLQVVFDRLYVLRNQLVHGGATWNSKVNRAQVRDGAAILYALLPAMIGLILDHPELELGEINFPVI